MAIFNASNPNTIYKDPRANIVYGSGNRSISDDEIRNFINTPGRTDKEIENAAYGYGVSANQIANAMNGNPKFTAEKIDKYLAEQGVTKDLAQQQVPTVAMPKAVGFKPIAVGSNETVEGRMSGLLKDPNNPLNIQAQTFGLQQANKRGLLNSSIGISAAQDAMYKNALPIASQDASTFYDAKKTNSTHDLSAQMFNSDMQGRIGMFNAGTSKDMILQRESNDLNRYIADMDAGNKLAIANIQAMANDSGIMGDLGKNLMSLYQQTASDPNISPEVKTQIFNQLKSQFEGISSLLPSFSKEGKSLKSWFTSSDSGNSNSTSGNTSGGTGGAGTQAGKINILGYQVEPNTLAAVNNYEQQTGQKIDRSKVVPQQLINDLIRGPDFSDGDYARFSRYKSYIDAGVIKPHQDFNELFIAVQPPGTKRADFPLFYVYR